MERQKQQRNRRTNTCEYCRKFKRKCSRTQPCTACQKTGRECIFSNPSAVFMHTPGASTSASSIHTDDTAEPVAANSGFSTSDQAGIPPDICLRIGKVSITERIGGLLRSNVVQELDRVLGSVDATTNINPTEELFAAPIQAWFKPHSKLPLARLSGRSHGDKNASRADHFLPSAQQDVLREQFFRGVYPVCPLVSRQDLQTDGPVLLSLCFAVYYAAAVSMPLLECQRMFSMPKSMLVKKLNTAAADALGRADILNRVDLPSFQALLIYLTPQYMGEISRSHAIFIGAVVRQFQIAGHDRPPETDVESDRRLKLHLWQHLMFLNIRATEAVGPERTLVDDHFAEFPGLDEPESIVSAVRYECYGLHRLVFRERSNVDSGQLPIVELLDMVHQQIIDIRVQYLDHLDETDSLQKYAGLVGKLLLARAEGMVILTAHARNNQQWCEHKSMADLQNRAIRSSLEVIETALQIDSDPQLTQWSWYTEAYHQYHAILFPLTRVCLDPGLPEADRLMTLVDHVFGPSPMSTVQQRATSILRALREYLQTYLSTKGIDSNAAAAGSPQATARQAPSVHLGAQQPTGCALGVSVAAELPDNTVFNPNQFVDPFPWMSTDQVWLGADEWWQWPPADFHDASKHYS